MRPLFPDGWGHGKEGKTEHLYAVSSTNLEVKYSPRAKVQSNFAISKKLAHEAMIQITPPHRCFAPKEFDFYLSLIKPTSVKGLKNSEVLERR